MPERQIEQFVRPEVEKGKEGRQEAQKEINEMVDYVIELRNQRFDAQAELNSLSIWFSVQPEGAQDGLRIKVKELEEKIADFDQGIDEFEEFFRWAEEQGDELEVAEK